MKWIIAIIKPIAALFTDNLVIIPTGTGPSRLGYIGSVVDVISGKIASNLDGQTYEARD